MLSGFGNSFKLDDFSNYRIDENDKKREILKTAENRKCLSVIQI